MLRTNTALWRIAFLSGFGVLPSACGGHTADADAPAGGDVPGGTTGPGTSTLGTTHPGTPPTATSTIGATPTAPSTSSRGETKPPTPRATGSACIASAPDAEFGFDTGLERCSDGRLHRPVAVECRSLLASSSPVDAGAPDGGAASGGAANGTCTADSECTEKPLGHCDWLAFDGGPRSGMLCQYGCQQDADCGPGFLCQCGERIGACVAAHCQTDSDCGSGLLCTRGTRNRTPGCSTQYEFFCERPDDACRVDADCPETTFGSYCVATDGARVCAAYNGNPSVCGRPFLVEGSARLAHVRRCSAWLPAAQTPPDATDLSTPERTQLASAWSQLGLMEHASVAAFARFTLQLLSVGAPHELVEQSQRALADELLHARLCFGLASAYAGEPIGPGRLPTERALDLDSLEDIAALALHEGCVGETSAAIEASEALALARDPAVRAALARIADDERRHAELAWRFMIWALKTGGPSVQRRIERELARLALASGVTTAAAHETSFDLAPHGILSAEQRAELHAAALRDVVLPCARALLPFTSRHLAGEARA